MQDDQSATVNTQAFIEPLYRGKFWMQLIGVMLILVGLFTALTIIGIIICWIPIWAGVSLMQAAGSIDQAYSTGSPEAATLAARRLKTYFTIFGVLTLIYLIVVVLGFTLGLHSGMMGMMMGGGHGGI